MADSTIKINNVAYSWSMINVTVSGQSYDLSGVTGIEYNIHRNVATNYGLGGNPANRGFGNIEYTASITMDYNAIVAMRGSAQSLLDIGEFDMVISFSNPIAGVSAAVEGDDWNTHTITLQGCFFNEDGLSASQDDTTISKTLDLNPFKITTDYQTTTA